MKILFLCGSVEPGKDGVGDYTRRLCGELIRTGHEAQIVSLCDDFVNVFCKQTQVIEETFIKVSRIPNNTSYKQRLIWTQDTLDTFAPDWISLQFVLYSFHPKGLPFWLTEFLKQLRGNYQSQIMFHELWVGRSINEGIKSRIISYTQQFLIKKLLKEIKPEVIHTHLPIFSDNLKAMGYNMLQPLNLFSNVVENIYTETKSKNRYRIGFFSQVNTNVEIVIFINQLCSILLQQGIKIELVIIGGSTDKVQKHIDIFKVQCPMLTKVFSTGFLNNSEVSIAIQQCDLGITPIPIHALGKSGSTVAFLAHGIPVAAPIIEKEYSNSGIGFFDQKQTDSIVTKPSLLAIEIAKEAALAIKKEIEISKISLTFVNNLKQNKYG